jgi:hypothetical protein
MASKKDFDWLEDRPDWMKNAYRLNLEVEYRRSSGSSFQLLFDRIMRSIHGDDYAATATYGNQGDLGCDGILRSRKTYFAVYAPNPYFRLKEAQNKMRKDFVRLLECWEVAKQVKQWTFVINYPGAHPSLMALAEELEESHPGLKVFVWSRHDLTQQLLAYARIDLLLTEFGRVENTAQELAPLTFVPEDTSLPSEQAILTYKRLKARLTGQKSEYDVLTDEWLTRINEEPLWDWFLVHNQFLVCAMAAATATDAFRIGHPPLNRLKFETAAPESMWRKHFKTAWGGAASLILKDEYTKDIPPIGDDLDYMYGVCLLQDALTLATIRITSRITEIWETEILEDVWSYVTRIKIHKEER